MYNGVLASFQRRKLAKNMDDVRHCDNRNKAYTERPKLILHA